MMEDNGKIMNDLMVQKIRRIMCSGRLYNPFTWQYFEEPFAEKVEGIDYAAIMSKYQVDCRRQMYEYNSLPHDESGDKRRRELLIEIFGERDNAFCWIEPPFNANYGGHHTKIKGIMFANFNLTLIEDGEIEIGDKVMIGPNVTIATAEHPKDIEIRSLGQGILYNKKIVIGNNVWIGAGVTILAGAVIGDNCIIGANSVVTKDTAVPANTLACGVINNNYKWKQIK